MWKQYPDLFSVTPNSLDIIIRGTISLCNATNYDNKNLNNTPNHKKIKIFSINDMKLFHQGKIFAHPISDAFLFPCLFPD